MWIVFAPVLATWFGVGLSYRGDPRLVNYILEHGYLWLTRQPPHLSFWNPPVFFPYPNVSAFTDVLIGSGFLYWPWRLLGLDPETSLVLWQLAVFSANFGVSYVLLRSCFSFSRGSSSLGAYLFTFASIRMCNIGHLQLFPQFWIALGALATLKIFDPTSRTRQQRLFIAVLAAALVLQAYTAFYTFYFFSLLLLVSVLIALCVTATRAPLVASVRRHAATLAFVIVIAALALLPLTLHYLEAASVLGDYQLNLEMIPHPCSFFLMGPRNIVYGALQHGGAPFAELNNPNQSNGLGLVTMAVTLAGLVLLRRRLSVMLLVLATAVLLVIAMRFGDFTLWQLMRSWVPAAGALRAVGRISMLLLLPASIGLSAAFERLGTRWFGIPAVLLALVCAAEQVHRVAWIELEHERAEAQAVSERVPAECSAFYLVCVGPADCRHVNDDALWAQLGSATPTINGRYGHSPPRFRLQHAIASTPAQSQELRAALEQWCTRHDLALEDVCWVEYPGFRRPGEVRLHRWPPFKSLKPGG